MRKQAGINWMEFISIIERGIKQNVTAAQMFELMNTARSGKVSPSELKAALERYGCNARWSTIDKMVRA